MHANTSHSQDAEINEARNLQRAVENLISIIDDLDEQIESLRREKNEEIDRLNDIISEQRIRILELEKNHE